jgi:hypothetical protein
VHLQTQNVPDATQVVKTLVPVSAEMQHADQHLGACLHVYQPYQPYACCLDLHTTSTCLPIRQLLGLALRLAQTLNPDPTLLRWPTPVHLVNPEWNIQQSCSTACMHCSAAGRLLVLLDVCCCWCCCRTHAIPYCLDSMHCPFNVEGKVNPCQCQCGQSAMQMCYSD